MQRAALFLFLLASSLSAQPLAILGEEVTASEPTFVPATGGALAAASNGSDYLTVWKGATGLFYQRISATGATASPQGFLLPASTSSSSNPVVASTGTDYLVAWNENRTIYTALIPQDPAATAIVRDVAVANERPTTMTLVASRGGFLLTVRDWQAGETWGLLLDRGGNAVSAPFAIHTAGQVYRIAAASDGTDYLIAFNAQPAGAVDAVLFTQRISGSGVVSAPRALVDAPRSLPALAYDGANFVLVWTAGGVTSAARLNADGSFAEAPRAIGTQPVLAITTDGSLALLYESFGEKLTAVPLRQSAAPLALDRQCGDCAVAATASGFLVASASFPAGIRHTVLPRDLSQSPAAQVTAVQPQRQQDVRVLALPQTTVVLWLEAAEGSGEWDIYAARVQSGRRLDGRGLHVGHFRNTTATAEQQWFAASDGQRILIAWRGEQQNVDARLLDAAGIASGVFSILNGGGTPRELLWTGEHFALLSTREPAGGGAFSLSYRLLTSSGTVVRDGEIDLAGTTFYRVQLVRAGSEWRLLGFRGRDLTLLPLRNDFSAAGAPIVIATTVDDMLPRLAVSDGADRIFVAWTVVTHPFPRPGAPTVDYQFHAVVDASGRPVRPAESADGIAWEGIWTGTSFLVMPFGGQTILRFSRDGAPLAPVAGTLDSFTWPVAPRFATSAAGTVVAYAGPLGGSYVAKFRPVIETAARRRSAAR